MFLGFGVRHAARKAAIAGGVVAAAFLATESGRKIAKVLGKTIKAGGEAAIQEIKDQRTAKVVDAGARAADRP